MPLPADRVYSLARGALDAVIAYYVAEAVDLPERRYVSDGPAAAWDCEQCVVYVERTFPGLADQQQPRAIDGIEVRSLSLQIEVVRCTPVMDEEGAEIILPDPADIEASAQVVLADAVMLAAGIRAAWKAGELAGCHDVVLDDWQGLGPLGGLVGGRLGVRIQLTQA